MANCDDLFQTFDEKISVSSARKKTLRKSRNAIRDRIRKHFKDVLKVTVPKFHGQGSYSMDTLVNPLEGCDYDIDDGVYLKHLGDDPAKWPTAARCTSGSSMPRPATRIKTPKIAPDVSA